MHRARALALGGALAATALLVQGSADAAGPVPAHDASAGSQTTLQFQVQFSPFHLTDIGPRGLTAGDLIDFHDVLLTNGRRVGDEVGSCVVVESNGLSNCTGVVRLGGDTITYAFVNAPPPRKVLAITGGSGRFRTAHGDGRLVENGDAANTGTLTLRLVR
jgi:hypothetical protein